MQPFRCKACNRLTLPISRFMFFTSEPMCQTCMKEQRIWVTK